MGFDLQLREILHRLPTSRQSLLFSATLPVSVAEFVKGGLINPVLIRLDTESKISPNLSMAFFPVKPSEKEGALLVVLENILQVRSDRSDRKDPQAIIFVCTKHHVEYLTYLLELAGYLVAHIYGSLDQIARRQQLEKFRAGEKSLLIVTDVAARGLDIPVMDNVINYDFPSSPRVFVHRVGRTARAGHQGSAWTFVTRSEMPHLFELQTFLGSPLTAPDAGPFGTLPPHLIDNKTEYVYTSLAEAGPQLAVLREVMQRGQSRFDRSRTQASQQAYREAKAFSQRKEEHLLPIHSFFSVKMLGVDGGELSGLLSSIASFKPNETVFASRERGQTRGVHPMKARLVSRSRSLTQLNEQYKEGSDRSEKVRHTLILDRTGVLLILKGLPAQILSRSQLFHAPCYGRAV